MRYLSQRQGLEQLRWFLVAGSRRRRRGGPLGSQRSVQ